MAHSRGYYESIADRAARRYGLDRRIFKAQINQESGFNPYAGSSAGARGIAQWMPETAKARGIDPMDAEQALYGAAKYMAELVRKFGSYRKALAAYNAGEGAVQKYNGIPPYAETQHYVRTILRGINNPTRPGQKPKAPAASPGGSDGATEAPQLSLAAQVNPAPQIAFSNPVAPEMLDTSKYLTNSATGQAPSLATAPPAIQTQNQTPTAPTTIATGGQAAPAPKALKDLTPAENSDKFSRLIARMNKINDQKRSYLYGGGHGGISMNNTKPIDCSAAVSLALGIPVRVSGDFAGWGKAGRSKARNAVNVYYNDGHVFMEANGHFWGTSKSNPGGGPGWVPRAQMNPAYLKGFKVRHVIL